MMIVELLAQIRVLLLTCSVIYINKKGKKVKNLNNLNTNGIFFEVASILDFKNLLVERNLFLRFMESLIFR